MDDTDEREDCGVTQRAYTIGEIDFMRQTLEMGMGRDFAEGNGEFSRRIEDRIRTYMLAGIEPSALAERYPSKAVFRLPRRP